MNVIELRYEAYRCFQKAAESRNPAESAMFRREGERLSTRADELQAGMEADPITSAA